MYFMNPQWQDPGHACFFGVVAIFVRRTDVVVEVLIWNTKYYFWLFGRACQQEVGQTLYPGSSCS